jgi:hypothetical protein
VTSAPEALLVWNGLVAEPRRLEDRRSRRSVERRVPVVEDQGVAVRIPEEGAVADPAGLELASGRTPYRADHGKRSARL